jgi:hypothetical protein
MSIGLDSFFVAMAGPWHRLWTKATAREVVGIITGMGGDCKMQRKIPQLFQVIYDVDRTGWIEFFFHTVKR